jgi:hypothetical protein
VSVGKIVTTNTADLLGLTIGTSEKRRSDHADSREQDDL